MHGTSVRSRIAVLMLLAAAGSCSAGSLLDTSSKGPSQAVVNSFMTQVAHSFGNGMASAHLLGPAGDRAVQGMGPSPTLVNVQVSQRTNCTSGGYINVTGSMTGSLDNNGTGVLQLQVTETINGWQCISGYTMDGAPYLSAAGTFSYLNGQQSTASSISFGGGFQWTGNGSGTCSIQMTMLFNPDGTGHLSGVACGYQVNESF